MDRDTLAETAHIVIDPAEEYTTRARTRTAEWPENARNETVTAQRLFMAR
jgi:hypothetical protein